MAKMGTCKVFRAIQLNTKPEYTGGKFKALRGSGVGTNK
jgi:hypothetical protein